MIEIQYRCLCDSCGKSFLAPDVWPPGPWPVDAEWKGPILCEACEKLEEVE